jgi:ABC-2 type transport system ATP-binding protein
LAARQPAAEIQGLHARYGRVEAVSGLDLTIEHGSLVALLGPNGAGKSTTINCLIGLKRIDEGRVVVAGTSPRQAVRSGAVGAMLQVSGLPSGAKVRDVLRLASKLHRGGADVDRSLAVAGLEEVAGREVTRLSGGQAQRVRFAMTIAGNPRLLFLDEPTVGMDVESRELFWREVRRLAEAGTTILFATHYLAEAERYADRVVVIAKGRLVADGTPSELRSRDRSEKVIELSSDEPERVRALDLSGARSVEIDGRQVRIRTSDADATMRVLYQSGVDVRDISVEASDLDDVFLRLTQSEEGS